MLFPLLLQMGLGGASADAELDELVEAAEAQILHGQTLVGRYGALLADFCMKPALLTANQGLQVSVLLALTKLMAVNVRFCEDNVSLLFTLLEPK